MERVALLPLVGLHPTYESWHCTIHTTIALTVKPTQCAAWLQRANPYRIASDLEFYGCWWNVGRVFETLPFCGENIESYRHFA